MDDPRKRQVQRALNWAYFYLKFRPRTKKEVTDYLIKKSERVRSFPQEVIKEVIEKLEEQGYVNDLEFVNWLVEQRTTHKHKGEIAIKQELWRLGIEKELSDSYFGENPVNQEEQALLALRPRWYRYITMERKERFQKVAAFLSRQGFPFDVIKKTIAEIENEE